MMHANGGSGNHRPSPRHELSHFGLTGTDVDERFADYLAAHRPMR